MAAVMIKIQYAILLALLIFSPAELLFGADLGNHSFYKITSYNLGAVLDSQDGTNILNRKSSHPLLITNTTTDILNSEFENTVSWVEINPHTTSSNTIALSATFETTDNLTLSTAFGVTRNLWTTDGTDYENKSSWEANLGVIYRLVNNLSYELHLGYMDPGDLFTDKSSYSNVESIIMVSNQLTLSF